VNIAKVLRINDTGVDLKEVDFEDVWHLDFGEGTPFTIEAYKGKNGTAVLKIIE
jgi:hypothetical protein